MSSSASQLAQRLAAVPRRAVLYVPGSATKALAKAAALDVDSVIVDLEDAVAPSAKAAARAAAAVAVRSPALGRGREVLLRINGPGSGEWYRHDVEMLRELLAPAPRHPPPPSLHGLVLPKVEGSAELRDLRRALPPSAQQLPLWAMVETPRGVLRAAEMAAAGAAECGLVGLIAGTSDLSAELRCDGEAGGRAALLHALSAILLAARGAGLVALDGVHLDLGTSPEAEARYAAACAQGRALGFDGKTVIHPKQVAPALAAFSPSPEALRRAAETVAAWEAAAAAGAGVAVLHGRLVENLHAAEARRLLALGAAIDAAAAERAVARAAASAQGSLPLGGCGGS
jgi:citrate lyase subunit beta/citryl-CoA lyase